MAVAFVMDFAGGRREHYDAVLERMQLGGRLPAGALAHCAGETAEGLRVVDVWESREAFDRFATEQIMPFAADAGLPQPEVTAVELHNFERASEDTPAFLQVFRIEMDAATYDEVHPQIARPLPEGVTWHAAGPLAGGWFIADAWTSKDLRDRFVEAKVVPAMQAQDVGGPPQVEDLDVFATLQPGARATA